ncbi:hypothetical protein HYPSUDRAFT_196712 [Hypholoma sublateritium FD-334 SS-4]|uniref:Uncharacterized protein n=1 Tax=Hypholoma sublateritium (strain FD-334 SS-4) TaxID=945553 RepID=A0A0D2QCI5_HYPSF|nr:hypothetical protein HYPSUDRAFT_196712 [Hypholoma sublateritium FD-334 SS-4]
MSTESTQPLSTNNDTADTQQQHASSSTAPSGEKILQRELTALSSCFKDAVVKTGQIYGFYADARKLHIEKHVSNPPRSLTTALGRDIEIYDQLCDSIETQLASLESFPALALKRDLRREEEKIEAETRRKNVEALMLPPALPASAEIAMDMPGSQSVSEGAATNPRNSPLLSTSSARRPSAISISSLHRPQFPLKLDLSATSLRITEEEAALFHKGLASPVTLAPKSARPMGPNEFPPELMAAFAASSAVPMDNNHDIPLLGLGVGLGDSSDKPIELDLDAMDIEMANMTGAFGNPVEAGESGNSHDGLFSPLLGGGDGAHLDESNLMQSAQHAVGNASSNFHIDSSTTDDLFGGLTPSADLGVDLDGSATSLLQPQSSSIPSHGDLLAQFTDPAALLHDKVSSSDNPVIHDADASFDINSLDLTNLNSEFFSNSGSPEIHFMGMNMQDFMGSHNALNMDSVTDEKGNADAPKA